MAWGLMTLREKLANWDNDYSHLEPFLNNTPISSSIIIPVYNEDKLLEKTLSNLSTHPQLNKIPDLFEIILVDDGSSEEIGRLVKKMSFPCCFNYFRFNDNKGRSKARNKGISMAKNELLFFFLIPIFLSLTITLKNIGKYITQLKRWLYLALQKILN